MIITKLTLHIVLFLDLDVHYQHRCSVAAYIGGAHSQGLELIWELQFLLLWLQSPLPHRDRGVERWCKLHTLDSPD